MDAPSLRARETAYLLDRSSALATWERFSAVVYTPPSSDLWLELLQIRATKRNRAYAEDSWTLNQRPICTRS